MTSSMVYDSILSKSHSGKKQLCILLDPDELRLDNIDFILRLAQDAQVDYFFIGGSIVVNNKLEDCLTKLQRHSEIPLVLFPGNVHQISPKADAILYLSLISGRNPELLIGQHVQSAPLIRQSGLEVIPTGYMLIDGGLVTSVQYISGTVPIPHNKADIAICTAMAGEMLGHKLIYMDAGSGAIQPISNEMIEEVRKSVQIPMIVGGGIRTAQTAFEKARAGADAIVVGNAVEKDPTLIIELSHALKEAERSKSKSLGG